jgi:DHA1 family tetracycline resistance protein-like MFS transporter
LTLTTGRLNSFMQSRKASLIFVFITVLVDIIGIGIIIPAIPKLIEKLTGQGLSDAAFWGGLLMTTYAVMQFLFAPILGELSDRFGRRPVLLIALFGLGLDYILHAYAPTITWLFIGRILSGIAGASHTVATAYIADISTNEEKAKNFGLIGAAFGLGFIIGPSIGGMTAKFGVEVPFLIAATLTLLNFVYGFFFIPESLPKEKRRPINFSKMIPGNSILKLASYSFGGLVIALFLANIAGQALPSTWSFFTMKVYDWDESQVGISLSIVGVMVAIVQGGLIGFSVKRFGETKVIIGGFVLWTLGMTLFAFAFNQWLLYLFLIPYALGGVGPLTPTPIYISTPLR